VLANHNALHVELLDNLMFRHAPNIFGLTETYDYIHDNSVNAHLFLPKKVPIHATRLIVKILYYFIEIVTFYSDSKFRGTMSPPGGELSSSH
jgi:hypothetical protein